MAIGVVLGFEGGYVGGAVPKYVENVTINGLNFFRPRVGGASGGFACGFIDGTGTSWLNGTNFGQELGSGFKFGVVGGVTDGVVNGISSGFKANKAGLDFFSGKEKAIVQASNTINLAAIVSNSKLIPKVYAEGDYLDWTGTVEGPDGGSVFKMGTANVEYTYRVSSTSIDWETTFRINGSEIGSMLQNVGDGIAGTGYGLTLTGAGAGFRVPIATIGNGVSFGGSILESAATTNWQQGGRAIGFSILETGEKALINRIPYQTPLTNQILQQNWGLKIKVVDILTNN